MNTRPASKMRLTGGIGALAVISLVSAVAVTAGTTQAATPHMGATDAAPGTISTVVGGVGGPGKATTVGLDVCGLAAASGNLYLSGSGTVRKVNSAGYLTTPAGDTSDPFGGAGPLGLSGPAAKVQLGMTCGVAVDHSGNLVLAEAGRSVDRIVVVAATSGTFYGMAMTAGHIYDVAGTGAEGHATSGAVARTAPLGPPEDVTVDSAGNLIIADNGWQNLVSLTVYGAQVHVVAATSGTFYGQSMTAGDIYTVAGYDKRVSGDGGPAAKAGLGHSIGQVQTDAAGNLVIADAGANRIRVVAESTGTFYGQAMTAGDIYTVVGNGTAAGNEVPATSAALRYPSGVTADSAGNLVIGDGDIGAVRVVAEQTGTFYGQPMTAGDIYTVGATDGAALITDGPVAVDGSGNLVSVADVGTSSVQVLAATTGTFYGMAMTAGDIYTVAGTGKPGYSGNGGLATRAELPVGDVASDSAGDLFLADSSGNRILISPAATGTNFGRLLTAGDIYTVAGDGTAHYSGDGGPATKAKLDAPDGVAADAAGNLVIADSGNRRVRVVAATTGTFYGVSMTAGDIYTVAGGGTSTSNGTPATSASVSTMGVAVDSAGDLVIMASSRVRVVAAATGTFYGIPMTGGDIYTVAGDGTAGYSGDGGPATSAELHYPSGVAVNSTGNLVIADFGNNRVRVVAAATGTFYGIPMTGGDIYTVAGDGTSGYSGDGGPATSAELDGPTALAVDSAGNLMIADFENNRVRVVAAATGTFYGIPMTAGDIYTVAGDGTPGYSGDGGPATSAELDGPAWVATTPSGGLLISDYGNGRIRLVTG